MSTLEGLLRRPFVAVAGTGIALALALWQVSFAPTVDLDVYRAGGEAWLAGSGLFDAEFPPRPLAFPLPFIYPPISAVLFSGLTVLPLKALGYLMATVTVLALLAACVVTARRCGLDRAAGLGLGAVGCAVMIYAEPVRGTLDLGQVNVLLMTLVVLDCLLPRTPWPRGLLIGIAAGIKLTPLIFVLYFVASGRARVAVTVVTTFVGSVVLGFLLDVENSLRYWSSTVFKLDAMVGTGFVTNQSLRGVLARFGLDKAASFPFWAIGVALVLAVTWSVVRRLLSDGAELQAMLVIAAAGLLCSPISWSNHWVWVAVAGTGLATASVRAPRWSLLAPALVVAVFFVGPHAFVPGGGGIDERWTIGEWFLGNAFFLTAVVTLGVLAARRRTTEVVPDAPRYAELSS
ncbi:glycosyltransferase 87 family protein [Allokutzneria sp. A3M-2-11 16]|uniref:glycosyltransferase 87 family protein n=1 Tax=Allokutzneria sp. A3M-2-11 16 TaxID=2962043 RepID=UPI0020B6C923|nr:glycosyltransferase 87 family protein [Allokutzneria sp. A3M-2-11 16]MCP3801445.1 glycosyltransferase 87 family protein [Allokutzneria sp. A3M-2-11 16]